MQEKKREKKESKVGRVVRVPDTFHKKLKQEAAKRGTTIGRLVEEAFSEIKKK